MRVRAGVAASSKPLLKLRALEAELEACSPFGAALAPTLALEQYSTPPRTAAAVLHCAASHGDLGPGVTALDLGTGGGVLAAGCALLGCASVLALDVDPNALQLARRNLGRMGLLAGAAPPSSDGDEEEEEEESGRGCGVELVLADALALPLRGPCVDTAVLNPPFGARRPGADVEFLLAACALARGAVYSLHKSSTREHIRRVAASPQCGGGGWRAEVALEVDFVLPQTYAFHRDAARAVAVDVWRLSRR